jgi:hypothetical protein
MAAADRGALRLGAIACAATTLLLCALAYANRARLLPRKRGSGDEQPTVLLVDNGSLRAASFLSLRAMAAAVAQRSGVPVTAASARFADRVPAAELGGVAGDTLATAARRALRERGEHHFVILPAFLGPADTLRNFIPTLFAALVAEHPGTTFSTAAPLVQVRAGPVDGRLARALAGAVARALAAAALAPEAAAVVLCDHGSPHADVGAVRDFVAWQLEEALSTSVLGRLRAPLAQASMERREGAAYDFNDPLLAKLLRTAPHNEGDVVLALLFLSPGAHAGEGGDIDEIVAEAIAEAAAQGRALRVHKTELLGPHVTDILCDRLGEELARLRSAGGGGGAVAKDL